ncbi:hypothetical protein LINPERHAP2_LOCUS41552 [Linum perenne]
MPNLAAESVAQGKNMSATRQSGRISSIRSSRGCRSELTARKSLGISSFMSGRELIVLKFWQPSGSPVSVGKGRIRISRSPQLAAAAAKKGRLRSVVTIVDLTPGWDAKSLAKCRNGTMWPGAKYGKKKMFS